MGIKRFKLLYDSSAVTTTDWVALDTRNEENSERVLQVSVTTGDTIKIQGTTKDTRGGDKSFLDDLTTADITDIASITATDDYTLVGPWTYIRVVKTGTNGAGKVQGYI